MQVEDLGQSWWVGGVGGMYASIEQIAHDFKEKFWIHGQILAHRTTY